MGSNPTPAADSDHLHRKAPPERGFPLPSSATRPLLLPEFLPEHPRVEQFGLLAEHDRLDLATAKQLEQREQVLPEPLRVAVAQLGRQVHPGPQRARITDPTDFPLQNRLF